MRQRVYFVGTGQATLAEKSFHLAVKGETSKLKSDEGLSLISEYTTCFYKSCKCVLLSNSLVYIASLYH